MSCDPASAVDFKAIATNIREYVPPSDGLDTPYSVDALADGLTPQVLSELIRGLYEQGVEPEKCVFYISHNRFNEFRMNSDMLPYGGGNSFQGRPIRTHATMPDDVVLYLAPDAVGLGGKVYNPLCIAYADIGSLPEQPKHSELK